MFTIEEQISTIQLSTVNYVLPTVTRLHNDSRASVG